MNPIYTVCIIIWLCVGALVAVTKVQHGIDPTCFQYYIAWTLALMGLVSKTC